MGCPGKWLIYEGTQCYIFFVVFETRLKMSEIPGFLVRPVIAAVRKVSDNLKPEFSSIHKEM